MQALVAGHFEFCFRVLPRESRGAKSLATFRYQSSELEIYELATVEYPNE